MRSLIAFFIKNQVLVNLLMLVTTFLGLAAVFQLNSSFFPKTDEKFIIVEAVLPGSSPEEVEEGITLKIEDNLKGVSGIERVTSVSYENRCRIQVELETGADADEVLQDVKNGGRPDQFFPVDMERLVVFKQEVLNFTSKFALVGEVSMKALKEKAEQVEDELRALPNLSKITIAGFTDEEIEVAVKENTLRQYGLTFDEIARAIQSENRRVTGGTIKGDTEYLIRANNRFYYADQLRDIVVRQRANGSVVRLKDVAEIRDDWSENTNRAFFNGKPAVIITINTLNEENILNAAANVNEYIEEFNERNTAIEAVLIDDNTKTLKERINLLRDNGLIGAFLVFAILGLFLRIRLAFWVAVGIPISFLGMIILAPIFGITINVLSLFGMILVVGILVDDGIVIGENIFQRYERGEPPIKAAVNGTMEVMPSVLSAILTTCVAFGIFFFIDGQLGDFFADVAFVVIAALLFSLIEVFLFLPAHLAHTRDMSQGYKGGKFKDWLENLIFFFRDALYSPVLKFALKYKTFAFLVAVALLIFSLNAVRTGIIQSTFFPNIEQNSISANLEMPAGTSEKVTTEIIKQIEQSAIRLNEKYANDPAIGKSLIVDREIVLGPSSNEAVATFYLLSAEQRNVRSFEVASDLRDMVGAISGVDKLSFSSRTPFGKPVDISFSATDYNTIRQASAEFMAELEKKGTVKDLITNDNTDLPEIEVSLTEKGRLLGFTVNEVMRQVRNGFFGYETQRLQRGDDEVKVWVRYAISDRNNPRNLREMRLRAANGTSYPLKEIAELTYTKGLLAINHRDGRREITVQGELASLQLSGTAVLAEIQNDIMPNIEARYPTVDISYEGQQRETRKLANSLPAAGTIALILMITLLVFTFRSYSQTWALLMVVPFGLIGAAWGHYFHGLPISLLSFLGFVALTGVLINDGLVFINAFNQYLRDGAPYEKALFKTVKSRFRPILLTTITTAAGLTPLIFEKSFQAQFLIPMAVTIAYGLLAGSFFITTLLPITLTLTNRIKVYLTWLWVGQKPKVENVERAIKLKKHDEAYQI